ncbi:TolC family outer membrane protein [Dongshaea marina]|uniref:TolC family outer membrane protein n=1 Tax=Dongshaea marina TaxID=2047966 RepID=UPI000D3E42A2|nr:TolC family outer membrane protein [Dongshaea marina]
MKKLLTTMVTCGLLSFAGSSGATTLEEAVSQSVLNHPEVKGAYHKLQSREADQREAQAGYYPSVDVAAGVGYDYNDNTTTRATGDKNMVARNATLTLQQMLFDGFATPSNVNRTEQEMLADKYSLMSVAENTALSATAAYLNLLKQKQILELSQQNLKTHQRIYREVKKRTDSGLGSTADLSQIEGRLAQSRSNVISATNNYEDAEATYIRVIGAMPKDLQKVQFIGIAMPHTLKGAIKRSVEHNPTMLLAQHDIEAAMYQNELAKAGYYPTVNLELTQDWESHVAGVKQKNTETSAMLQFRYNLFKGGADVAKDESTAALHQQAKDIRDNTYRQVEEGVRLAWNARESLEQQKKYLNRHVIASRETVVAYKKQFELGKRTLLDLLNTENELFESQKSYIEAESDELAARYRILNAMGELLNAFDVAMPPVMTSQDQGSIEPPPVTAGEDKASSQEPQPQAQSKP